MLVGWQWCPPCKRLWLLDGPRGDVFRWRYGIKRDRESAAHRVCVECARADAVAVVDRGYGIKSGNELQQRRLEK